MLSDCNVGVAFCFEPLGLGLALGVGLGLRGGLLPTNSHSIFYSRVGQIAIFSHWQP